jgi:heme-degrading monooxygenase HmoA
MISRHWRGLFKPEYADDYVEHLRTQTFPAIQKLTGFVGASILRREAEGGIEFLVITKWASLDSIREFAGPKVETAVVPKLVQEMLIEYDPVARHYEVGGMSSQTQRPL